jgi:hypothetical protein
MLRRYHQGSAPRAQRGTSAHPGVGQAKHVVTYKYNSELQCSIT